MIFLYIILGYVTLGRIVFFAVDKDDWLKNEENRLDKGTRNEQLISLLVFIWLWPLTVYKWINRK